jgi:hypothetical protein
MNSSNNLLATFILLFGICSFFACVDRIYERGKAKEKLEFVLINVDNGKQNWNLYEFRQRKG